jgi:uracil-DNA glycosylase
MAGFDVPQAWRDALQPALETAETQRLQYYLADEMKRGTPVFPPRNLWFHTLELVPPDAIRIVILGQDPYHGAGQAHGLAFSVPDRVRPPPSLKNIFKELQRDLGIPAPQSGNLERWAQQGVLLLNTVLTVEEGKAGSHQGRGWEEITDAVIAHAGRRLAEPAVFMLWGSHAQKKRSLIDTSRHLVLEAPHPSPLSAHRGFLGCGHFGKANAFLTEQGLKTIAW